MSTKPKINTKKPIAPPKHYDPEEAAKPVLDAIEEAERASQTAGASEHQWLETLRVIVGDLDSRIEAAGG